MMEETVDLQEIFRCFNYAHNNINFTLEWKKGLTGIFSRLYSRDDQMAHTRENPHGTITIYISVVLFQ